MAQQCDVEHQETLDKMLGMGESSVHKNYYSLLQEKVLSLEETEYNLRVIFNNSYEGIMISDFEGSILDVNDRMLKLYACSRDEMLKRKIADISDETELEAKITELLKKSIDEEYLVFEWHAKQPTTGKVFEVSVALHKIQWYGHEAVLSTVNDISERKLQEKILENAYTALEELNLSLEDRVRERTLEVVKVNFDLQNKIEELKLAQEELIRSEKLASLGELVAGVSHEINTPLGVAVTAASFLETSVKEFSNNCSAFGIENQASGWKKNLDKWEELSKMILSNLNRAANLVKSFKQVSVDRTNDIPRRIDVSEYIDEIIISMMPTIRKSGHQFLNNTQKGISVTTYPGAISQIVTNLITNSLVHGFAQGVQGVQGKVEFNAERTDDLVCIIYSDNGVGMEPEVLSRIFDPFYTTKRNEGGTGLGLFIIHNLVSNQLHGRVECTSVKGEGTEFKIIIPCFVGDR